MRPVCRCLGATLFVALATACHPAVPAAQSPDRAGGGRWTRSLDGIPVVDDSGRAYAFPFLGGLDHPRPQLVDIDGDGDLDLFVQEYTGHLMYFENTGSPGAPRFAWRTDRWQDLDVGEWSRFADLDRDGVVDILAESPFSYIRYFRNEGTRTDPRMVLAIDTVRDAKGEPIFSDRQNIPQVVDVDCNGRLDLLLGRASGRVTRYEMAHGGPDGIRQLQFLTDEFQGILIIGQQFGSLHGANTMVVSDIDQDGDPDIIWGDFFEAGLLWLVNSGTCGSPNIGRDTVPFPPNAPLSTSGYNAPAIRDLDGDGDLDVLVGVLGGAFNPNVSTRDNLLYLEQTGKLAFTLRTTRYLSQVDLGSETQPALADLDGDGDLDILAGNKIEPVNQHTGGLYWLENTGSRQHPSFALRGLVNVTGLYHMAPAIGDLDGDGSPDLLLGTFKDAVRLYRLTPGHPPSFALVDSSLVRITRGSNTTPALGDLDDDGDLDLLVGESSGMINWYRNDGTKTAPRFTLVSDAMDSIDVGRRSAPALTDLDGDGDLDLVVGSESGTLQVYRNTGTRKAPHFERDEAADLELPPYSAPAFGDLDGDARSELVAGAAGGGLLLYFRK